jgi:hypothetical protein
MILPGTEHEYSAIRKYRSSVSTLQKQEERLQPRRREARHCGGFNSRVQSLQGADVL